MHRDIIKQTRGENANIYCGEMITYTDQQHIVSLFGYFQLEYCMHILKSIPQVKMSSWLLGLLQDVILK